MGRNEAQSGAETAALSARARTAIHLASAATALLLLATPLAAVPVMAGFVVASVGLVLLAGRSAVIRVARASAAGALGFLALATLASRGALDPGLHWVRAFQVAGCVAAAAPVVAGGRLLAARVPFAAARPVVTGWLAVAAALIATELAHPGLKAVLFAPLGADVDPLKLNRPAEFLAALLVLVLAASVAMRRWTGSAGLVFAALALGVLTSSETARLLLLVGVPLAALTPVVQRAAAALSVAGVAALGLLAFTPFYAWVSDEASRLAVFAFRPETFAVRLEIWERVAGEAAARPWGGGLEATRQLVAAGVDFSGATYRDAVLWHPHNLGLQLLIDLGWMGFAAAVALGAALVARVARLEPEQGGVVGVAVVAAILHVLFAHSAWHITPMAVTLSLAFLAAWIAVARPNARGGRRARNDMPSQIDARNRFDRRSARFEG